jgi:uncharacterized Fe-S center protein
LLLYKDVKKIIYFLLKGVNIVKLKLNILCSIISVFVLFGFAACNGSTENPQSMPDTSVTTSSATNPTNEANDSDLTDETLSSSLTDGIPKVYMTTDISPEGLMAVYQALGLEADGDNVGVKISTGEPGGKHFLDPNLIKNLVQYVDGTLIECNTLFQGRRASTAMHYQVAKDHGFTEIADVVILDEDGTISLPVTFGTQMTENIVGSKIANYDFHIVLSHFKGHSMAGLGGALKNLSIGYASANGKGIIHNGGQNGGGMRDQDGFLKAMAEAAKSVVDYADGNILYINVMNHLSVDCDCDSNPAAPTMGDIGILASLDPVALDQACVDLVYAASDGADLIERMESRNGILTITHAEDIGLGSREYTLVNIDD